VTTAAGKVYEAVGLAWAALSLTVEVLDDIERGTSDAQGRVSRLAGLLQSALRAYDVATSAYQALSALQASQSAAGGVR
jgi:hypothetical protein